MTQRKSDSLPNPYRLSIEQFLKLDGRALDEILAAVVSDIEPAPALCTQLCEVEPDGTCPHGCPSLLRGASLL
jgi:hypothetical protein